MSAALKLQKKNPLKKVQVSSVSAIRSDVLKLVGISQFQAAIQLLKDFSNNDFPYPSFKLKVERYVNHSIDLVLAIEANRNFMNSGSLTKPKQNELKDKFKKHFEDLKSMLHKIEVAYDELRSKDNKSTKYLVQAVWAALVIVAVNALLIDIVTGLAQTAFTVLESALDYFSNFITKLL